MTESKETLKTNEVSAPTLFVGVGGTGCKIVKKVADLCAPAEKENINFLCMDTNVNDLSTVANGKSKIYWIQTSNTQTVGSYLDYDDEARKKWFPKNAVMYDKTVSEGAGQVRAISRLALNSTIKTGKIRPLYDSIDDLFRKTGKDMKQAMRVVIASTASGGTGSGIILPLSMFIRDYIKEKYPNTSLIVRALILLPETLDSVIDSQTERDSQARNAYATIKELNAFMMKGSGFIDLDEDLKQFSNLHVDVSIAGSDDQKSLSLLPMDFCFLMDGQDAEDSTMISISQYIEQAAQALYEQNIGPMQKKAFSVEDNIIKEMTKPGNYGRNRFGGIGAGVICYPYEKIADYVSYNMAIDSIGGEGEATKWTKYDKQVDAYHAEQDKLSIPRTARKADGVVYCEKLVSSNDMFSKDLKNAYNLSNFDEKIELYLQKFQAEAVRMVLEDANIKDAYKEAEEFKQRNDIGKSPEATVESAYTAVALFAEQAKRVNKDGNLEIRNVVNNWVDALMTNEKNSLLIDEEFSLEYLLKTSSGEFMHPCAARYAIYQLIEKIQKFVDENTDHISAEETVDNFASNDYPTKFGKFVGLEALVSFAKTEPTFVQKMKGFNACVNTAASDIQAYYDAVEDFCRKTAINAAYKRVLTYLKDFSEQYKKFFDSFANKVKDLDRKKVDLVDELKYQKGDSFMNICATEDLLGELSDFALQKAKKTTTLLNKEINAEIFDSVKLNAICEKEIKMAEGGFIEEDRRVDIFDDTLMNYFRKSVREKCDDIDRDIIGAIELEQRLKERIRMRNDNEDDQVGKKTDLADVRRHIAEVVAMGARIAAPSVQRVNNEEPREIKVCAYNKSLLDNRKFRVKDLIPNGEAVDTVSKYEIHFYNALYNLTPNKLKKFAAPFETETGKKNAGTYHKAYTDYSRLIGPDSTKNAAISTHIDKSWDSIKSMPELDFGYQQQVINKVHKAYIYGLIHQAIKQKPLSQVANGKKVFMYRDSDNRDVELQVPNGTLCDEFYEVLDALYVNSKVVEDIGMIKNRKRAMSEAKNCNYESTEFFKDMADFNLMYMLPDIDDLPDIEEVSANHKTYDGSQQGLEDLKKRIRKNVETRSKRKWDPSTLKDDGELYVENPTSLFAIPLMFYCTLPNSGRYISEITAMVDAVIDVFREEYTKWEKEEDVKFVLCNRLTDELHLLQRNYSEYQNRLNAPPASENPVIDIIQRKIRDVIMTAPEPEDYEALLDRVAKEFKEGDK